MELRECRTDTCPPDRVSPGWKVELLEGGRSLSRLWVVDRQVRVGGCVLRVGGIACVGTSRAHRGKGLASRVMEAAQGLMRREGYHASILHGIPNFYHRFGYAPCMPEYALSIPASHSRRAPGGLKLRTLRPADLPAVAELYNRENAGRTGTAVRDPRTWKGFPRSTGYFMKPAARLAVDGEGRLRGYLVWDDDHRWCRASEAGGSGAEVHAAFWKHLAARAAALGKREILLAMPPDHAFSLYLRDRGCVARINWHRNGKFMGRIVDFPACMGAVAAGLGRSWESRPEPGRVSLATDLGAVTLEVRAGVGNSQVTPAPGGARGGARLGQAALFQLLMGYRTPRDLADNGGLKAAPGQLSLLSRWFPLRMAHMWWADRF